MNLFQNLYRWVHRQYENFTTESFVFVIEHLLEHERAYGLDFLNWLCFDESGRGFGETRPKIDLQFFTDEGIPDIFIRGENIVAIVEVKKEAGLGKDQLKRYRGRLNKHVEPIKRLILLTEYKFRFGEKCEKPDQHITWHEVAKRLESRPTLEPVSEFLIRQLIGFLKEQRMAIDQVDVAYLRGMEAHLRLRDMIEKALEEAEIRICGESSGAEYWCLNVSADDRFYEVRIGYKTAQNVWFEFDRAIPKDNAKPEGWTESPKGKLRTRFVLDERFFSVPALEQLRQLKEFFRTSHNTARDITVTGIAAPNAGTVSNP